MSAAESSVFPSEGGPSVLLVDDEQQVLTGLALHLKRRYTVIMANSGAEALERLAGHPDIAIIVSDMRMPGMNGAEFLAKARQRVPEAVRMLLTGQTDIQSAIAAVNEGQIFQFLTKPTLPPAFLAAVEGALAQYRLITAEKVLLAQTLRGSVQAMAEILEVTNPVLFGRATRVQRTVLEMATHMGMEDHWQIGVAAMLSQLALISLPADVADKLRCGSAMSSEEQAMINRLPEVTDRMLGHIPRLETVRVLLAHSQEPYRQSKCVPPESEAPIIIVGAKLLKAASAYDQLTLSGLSCMEAIGLMNAHAERYDQAVLGALSALYSNTKDHGTIAEVPLSGLMPGMVLADDLMSNTGVLLVARGYAVTAMFLERIRNFKKGSLKETVRVVRGR